MITPIRNIFAFFIALLIVGCATEQYTKPLDLPAKESSTISITRPSTLWNDTISVPIYVNGSKIGMLPNGGTLTWKVRPGTTTVSISGSTIAVKLMHQISNTKVKFNAQKGESYHLTVTSPYQVNMAIPTFEIRLK